MRILILIAATAFSGCSTIRPDRGQLTCEQVPGQRTIMYLGPQGRTTALMATYDCLDADGRWQELYGPLDIKIRHLETR